MRSKNYSHNNCFDTVVNLRSPIHRTSITKQDSRFAKRPESIFESLFHGNLNIDHTILDHLVHSINAKLKHNHHNQVSFQIGVSSGSGDILFLVQTYEIQRKSIRCQNGETFWTRDNLKSSLAQEGVDSS